MKTVLHYLFVFVVIVVVAAPAYSAPQEEAAADPKVKVIQVWACQISDGVSEADADLMGEAQLRALRQMPGGEEAQLRLLWPVAVNNTGDVDVHVVVEFPSFVAWGELWEAFSDASPLAKADDATEGRIVCPDSVIWEVHEVVVN